MRAKTLRAAVAPLEIRPRFNHRIDHPGDGVFLWPGTARAVLRRVLVRGGMHTAPNGDCSEDYRIAKQGSGHRAENDAVVCVSDQSAHWGCNGAADNTRLP